MTLLQVSRTVQGVAGVAAAQVAMATPLNVEVLTEMGFAVPAEAGPNDMVVAIRLDADGDLDAALAGVDAALADTGRRDSGPSEEAPPRTTGSALRRTPGAVALVSVPGPSAFVEAMDALEAGSDVMVFSDNVPVEQELALKRYAAERSLLVMGPDCGTAVVGGLGLGFANTVSPGPVGIVAASGTGCQQVLALLDHAGVGVSSALGVGGRDLVADVRGLATREAMRRLDADPAVELIAAGLQAPAPRTSPPRSASTPPACPPRSSWRCSGPDTPTSPRRPRRCSAARGVAVPEWPVSGSAAAPSRRAPAARAVRRRHAVERGQDRRHRAARRRTPATRSSTSATTPTRPAAPTR